MKAASTRGKKFNQKIKPYVVLQYLLKYTDENNIVTAPEIVDFLEEHGIRWSASGTTPSSPTA